jgi:hypothetical protein
MLNQFIDIATQKIRAKRMEYFGKHPDVYTKIYAYTRSNLVKALGYYPYYPKIEKATATEVTIDGKQKIMLPLLTGSVFPVHENADTNTMTCRIWKKNWPLQTPNIPGSLSRTASSAWKGISPDWMNWLPYLKNTHPA